MRGLLSWFAAMLPFTGFPSILPAQDSPPGVAALVAASTDIAVMEVLETNPRRAIEGARDTVRLKIIRPLEGSLEADDTIGVYYHLLWKERTDRFAEGTLRSLEIPKFLAGKRYVVFLTSQPVIGPDGRRVEYRLSDRWMSVLPEHHVLEGEISRVMATGQTRHDRNR